MHFTEVDGYYLPKRIGGHAALDFCNTWAGWGEPPSPRREWLADYDRLAVWSGYAELLDDATVARLRRAARRKPDDAAQALTAARALRTTLHQAVLNADDTRALGRVASSARDAAASMTLEPGPGDRARWVFRSQSDLSLPVLAAARAGAELLTSAHRAAVKACPGSDCGWLFLDHRGRRRWCSMSSCGNRAKVRAHAARARAT